MKKITLIVISLIILVITCGGYYYWWYNTPHIVYDRVSKLFMSVGNFSRYGSVRTLNVTYGNDVCNIHETKFFETREVKSFANISRDDVISLLNQASMKIVQEGKMNLNYNKLLVEAEKDGKIINITVLYDNDEIVSFSCQKGNEEYVARWFIETEKRI